MRRIDYNFNGARFLIPDDLLRHELLVVVDGIIKAPQLKDYQGGDYVIDKNLIIFETRLEGVCVQLISVTDAIHKPSTTHAKRRSPYEPRGPKSLR